MHSSAYLVALVASASILGVAFGNKVLKIDLKTSHKYGELSLENLEKHVTEIQADRGVVPLRNFANMYYTGVVELGTPPQEFNVLFENNSPNLVVLGEAYCRRTAGSKEFCSHHNKYDGSKSSTYKKTGKKFAAVHRRIEGMKVVETMNVGNITVVNQTFGEIDKINLNIFGDMFFDGIMGISAYPSSSEMHVMPTILNMVKQGAIKDPVCAMYFKNCTCNCTMSQVMLGGVDPKHYTGDITYTDIIDKKDMKIKIEGMKLAGKPVVPPFKAVICSGCSMSYGPKNYTEYINKAIGAEEHGCTWTVDCSKIPSLPKIEFIVSGVTLVLEPQDYTLKLSNGLCRSVFVPYDAEDFIFGVSFLRPYMPIFDMAKNRIGFAKAK